MGGPPGDVQELPHRAGSRECRGRRCAGLSPWEGGGARAPSPQHAGGGGDAVQSFIHSQLFSHPCTREHPCLEAAGCTGEGWGVGPLVPRPPPSRAPHPPAQVLLSLPITQDPGTIPTGTLRTLREGLEGDPSSFT